MLSLKQLPANSCKEKGHSKAAKLVNRPAQIEVEGLGPEGWIEGIGKGGTMDHHHSHNGQQPTALDTGNTHTTTPESYLAPDSS